MSAPLVLQAEELRLETGLSYVVVVVVVAVVVVYQAESYLGC